MVVVAARDFPWRDDTRLIRHDVVYDRTMKTDPKMRDGPNIARVASLIGEPARAEMLSVLMAARR